MAAHNNFSLEILVFRLLVIKNVTKYKLLYCLGKDLMASPYIAHNLSSCITVPRLPWQTT